MAWTIDGLNALGSGVGRPVDDEIARVAKILEQRNTPDVIKKEYDMTHAGNSPDLLPVLADSRGRLWRETKDELVMVYEPKEWRGP
jgi:hypothetical protein